MLRRCPRFTGLNLHQWLGIAAIAIAFLHLGMHWNWAKAVAARFFGKTSPQARSYFLLDGVLFGGITLITLTGLVISSWFSLALTSYEAWRQVHVVASLVTMTALILKLALHWKYLAALLKPALVSKPNYPRLSTADDPTGNQKLLSRREALRVIGTVSVVGIVSILKAASALRTVEAAVLPQPALSTQTNQTGNLVVSSQEVSVSPTAAAQPAATAQLSQVAASDQQLSQAAESCVVRCDKGCSYPGRCRRYTDANNNQRCDLGECLSI